MADVQSNIHVNIDTAAALANIRRLQKEISAFHLAMSRGTATNVAQSANFQRSLINNINSTGQFSAQMTRISTTTESFTNSLERNQMSMRQYFRYAGGASKTFGRMFRSEFETINKVARERVKTLQTQYIKMGRDASGAMQAIAVRPLALDMNNLATKTAMAAQRQQLFNQLLRQGSTNLLNFGKNTQWAGRQLMVGFSIPLAMVGAAAAQAFLKMEEQAIRFKRVYGELFTTADETDKMAKSVQTLAQEFTKYGIAVEKTMGLAADVAAMGKMGQELLDQVTEATRLAVLGGVEQQEALEATISITNAFGVATEDLAKKIDFLNAVENQTVLSIEDLTIAIPKAGPVVQQLGGDVEDLAFFLTAMKEGGINASEGANALKSGLAALINPTAKAKEMLAEFGINIDAIVEGNAGDIKSTVVQFAQALDTLDPLNRARAIEQLFGKFQFSRISTLFQNVISEGSQAARVLDLTKATTEELAILSERELQRVEESTGYKFKKQMEDLKASLAPIGEEFLKLLTPILEFVNKALSWFNNLEQGTKTFVLGAIAIIGGLGPVFLMTFGLIANGAANLIKMFAFLGRMFAGLGGQSTTLGNQTEYMTQQQLEAAAVAASLEQRHLRLQQVFSSEAAAVNRLTAAYERGVIAQRAFMGTAGGRGAAPKKMNKGGFVPGYANGVVMVPGPRGKGDIVPAMLTPGEAVIPADMAKQYRPLIAAMIKGSIPGYEDGTASAGNKKFKVSEFSVNKRGYAGNTNIDEHMRRLYFTTDKMSARIGKLMLDGARAEQEAIKSRMESEKTIRRQYKGLDAPPKNLSQLVRAHRIPSITTAGGDTVKNFGRGSFMPETTALNTSVTQALQNAYNPKNPNSALKKFYDAQLKEQAGQGKASAATIKSLQRKLEAGMGDFTEAERKLQQKTLNSISEKFEKGELKKQPKSVIKFGQSAYFGAPAFAAQGANLANADKNVLARMAKEKRDAKQATKDFVKSEQGKDRIAQQKELAEEKKAKKDKRDGVRTAAKAKVDANKQKAEQNRQFRITDKTRATLTPKEIRTALNDGKNPNRVAGQKTRVSRVPVIDTAADSKPTRNTPRMGGGALSMGLMTAGMVAGMSSGQEGAVGDIAGKLMMPLMAASILPMLKPVAIAITSVVAVIGGMVYAGYRLKKQFDDTQKAAIDLGMSLGGSRQAVDSFAEFAGTVSASQYMDRVRQQKGGLIQSSFGPTFGETYVQSDAGSAQLENVRKLYAESGQNQSRMVSLLTQQLTTSIATGALSVDQARSIAAEFGQKLNDMGIAFDVIANITSIVGPNGENLEDGGVVEVASRIMDESAESLETTMGLLEQNLDSLGILDSQINRTSIQVGSIAAGALAAGATGALIGAAIGTAIPIPGIGTLAGALVGGGIGALIGGVGGYFAGNAMVGDANEQAAAWSGAAVVDMTNALAQQQQLSDAVDTYYRQRLSQLAAEGKFVEYEEERLKYEQARVEIARKEKQFREKIRGLLEAAQRVEENSANTAMGQAGFTGTAGTAGPAADITIAPPTPPSEDSTVMNALNSGMQNALDVLFKDDPVWKLYQPVIDQLIQTLPADDQYLFRAEFFAGMSPEAANALLLWAGDNDVKRQAVVDIVTNYGGQFANQTQTLLSMIDAGTLEVDILAKINAARTEKQAQDILDFATETMRLDGIINADIYLAYINATPGALNRLQNDFKDFAEAGETGTLTIDRVIQINPVIDNYSMTSAGPMGTFEQQIDTMDEEFFQTLAGSQRAQYSRTVSVLTAVTPNIIVNSEDFQTWLNNDGEFGGYRWNSYDIPTQVGEYIKATARESVVTGTDATGGQFGPVEPIVPTGAGAAPTNVYAPIEKGMGQFVDGAKKVSKTSAQALADIEKFANGAGDAFNGIANQMRNSNVGEPLIDFMLGMDPDEFEKEKTRVFTIENGLITGLTAAGEALQKALNTAKLGEFVNEQDKIAVNAESQLKAFKMMTAAGIESEYAYKLVQDTAFATALATEQSEARIQAALDSAKRAAAATAELEKAKAEADKTAEADPTQERRDRIQEMNEEFAMREKFIKKMRAQGASLTDVQKQAIIGNKDLMEEFMASGWDKKKMSLRMSDVLKTALAQAARQAEVDLQFKKLTISGMQEIFDQGFSNVQNAFSAMEEKLKIDVKAKIVFGDENYDESQKIVDTAKEQVDLLEFEIDNLEADLERISRQEDEINEKYDEKLEALEDIAEANERITRQQQSQLDIAQALASGDIGAAARAVQQARAQSAKDNQERQKELLEKQRQADLDAVRGTTGMSRADLEEQIKKLKEEIFNIEQDIIRPREEAIRLTDLQLEKDIEALTVLEKTREEWDAIKNQIDLATTSTDKYLATLQEALNVVKELGGSRGEMLNPEWLQAQSEMDQAKAAYDKAVADKRPKKEIQKLKKAYDAAKNRFDGTIKYVTGVNPDWQKAKDDEDAKYASWQESVEQKMNKKEISKRKKAYDAAVKIRRALPQYAAGGGKIDYMNMGGLASYNAIGGAIFKAINSDTVPAMLTPGEFVITRSAVDRFGERNLKKINNGTYSSGSMYNYNVEINVKSESDADQIANTVMRQIKRIDSQRVRGNRF